MTTSYMDLPDGWDAGWQAAKSGAQNAGVGAAARWITFLGDSITSGYNSSNWVTKSWVNLLRAAILARGYTLYGDFWHISYCADFETVLSGTLPFTVDPTSRSWFSWGFGKTPLWTAAGEPATPIIFSTAALPTPACTALDIVYLNGNAGTWKYSIDGGSPVTVTTTATTGGLARESITGLTSGVHTIEFLADQSADYAMQILGVATYSNTRGIGFGHIGFQSCSTGYYYLNNGRPTDPAKAWQGSVAGANTTTFGFPTQPALAVIALGINDCSLGTGLDQYQSALRRLAQSFRRGYPNASLLFIAFSNPDLVNSDVTSGGFTDPQNYTFYVERMRQVAQNFGGAFVNFHAKWADYGATLGYQATTQAHPGDTGHQDIATVLGGIL